MNARENLDRWIESMQILCGEDDNPTAERRAEYAEMRTKFLAAYDAQVFNEAAAILQDRAAQYPTRRIFAAGLRHGAPRLAKEAMGRTSRQAADFFQPGHSYTHRNGTDFRCVTVTTHPQTGERLAMGWHVDSWGLHYPTTVGINQWRHEYDGVAEPAEGGEDR